MSILLTLAGASSFITAGLLFWRGFVRQDSQDTHRRRQQQILLHRSDARRRARRRVAMGLELRGAGLLRGAFGSGSPAGPASGWWVRPSQAPGPHGRGDQDKVAGSERVEGAGLRRWLLLSGSGPGGVGLWPQGPGTWPSRVRADYIQCASSIGTGACLPTRRAGGGGRPHSPPPSPFCLKAAEAGHRPPDRPRLVPAGQDSRPRIQYPTPRPRAREGRAQLGTLARPRLGPVRTRPGDAAGDSEPG